MAIGFWAIKGEFNLSWWAPNLLLILLPIYWLVRIIIFSSSAEKPA